MSKFALLLNQFFFLASSVFPINELQITDAYSESSQTYKMKCLTKKVNVF